MQPVEADRLAGIDQQKQNNRAKRGRDQKAQTEQGHPEGA
jgi:hypothetical protein